MANKDDMRSALNRIDARRLGFAAAMLAVAALVVILGRC
jgi:hypothetical protein